MSSVNPLNGSPLVNLQCEEFLKEQVYVSVVRSILWTDHQALGATLPLRLAYLQRLRGAFRVSQTDGEKVLHYALRHNEYVIPCWQERAQALAVATSDKQKVKLVGADALLVPQRSDFDGVSKGCETWRVGEISELQALVQAAHNDPSHFGGLLQLEIVDCEVAPRFKPKAGCFACFGGKEEAPEPRDVYVSIALRSNTDATGDKGEQAHRTPAGAGVPGQRVSLKCAVAPLQVHREEAVLHVMLRDAAVGQSGGSFDHVVGQVHVPLSHIEHYAAGHGGTTSWQTFVCPVYSHASTSSKIGRKPKSGTHSAQYPETGLAGSDAVWDDEGETAGRAVYDPTTRITSGTHGREVRGYVKVRARYVAERRLLPDSLQPQPMPRVTGPGAVPNGVSLIALPSAIPQLPSVPGIAFGQAGGRGDGAAGQVFGTGQPSPGGGVRGLQRLAAPGASAADPGFGRPVRGRTAETARAPPAADAQGSAGTMSAMAALKAALGEAGIAAKDLTRLEGLDKAPALQLAIGCTTVVWGLWSAGVLENVDPEPSSPPPQSTGTGGNPSAGLRQHWRFAAAAAGVDSPKTSEGASQGARGSKHKRGKSVGQGVLDAPNYAAMNQGGVLGQRNTRSAVNMQQQGQQGGWGSRAPYAPGAQQAVVAGNGAFRGRGGVDEAAALLGTASFSALKEAMINLFTSHVPGLDPSYPPPNETIPGGFYFQILEVLAELYRLRPTMIRLALAAHVLDAWDARGTSIIWLMESCRRLLAPLAVLDAHKLLMVAESSMLASVTGAFMRRVLETLEHHYEVCSGTEEAVAVLGCVRNVVHVCVGSSSGDEVVRKLLRIHLGTAVERRMRGVLGMDRDGVARALIEINRRGTNSPGMALTVEELCHQANQADLSDVSERLVEWIAQIMDVAPHPSRSSHNHKRTSLTSALAAAATAASERKGPTQGQGTDKLMDPTTCLIVAIQVVIEDTQADLVLQPVFMDVLDLPHFTTHIRYRLLVDALQKHFSNQNAPVMYSPAVHVLEERLYELHALLQKVGLGAYSAAVQASSQNIRSESGQLRLQTKASKQDDLSVQRLSRGATSGSDVQLQPRVASRASYSAARASAQEQQKASEVELYTSPDGVVVRIEGPVELADITALLGPSVEVLIQTISQRLLVWVDKTVEAEQAAAEKAAAGQASVGAGKGGWKAMTSNHHSFSVIDLYFHLQNAVEAVARRVMSRSASTLQNAHAGKLLHAAVARAVRRYISYVEQRSVQQLTADDSGSPTAGPAPLASGTAAASAGSSKPPGARHHRNTSGSFSLGLQTVAPPTVVGAVPGSQQATNSNGAAGGGGGVGTGLGGKSGGVALGPVVTPELCVLLSNMEEVLVQQLRLEVALLMAVRGDLSGLEDAAGEAEADFLERHEPGAAAAATEPVPLAGGSSGKTRKTKRRLWGLGPKKSSGESSGSKWKSWGSQGSRSGQLKGPAVAAAATAAAADESDSDVSEVSLGDVAAVMVEEEEEDRSQHLLPSDPVEAMVFGAASDRLSVLVTRSVVGILSHVTRTLQARITQVLISCLDEKAAASTAASAKDTKASGARPIPQLLPSEVLHIKGLLAQELGSASQHLSDRLARKVASACLQAALNAVGDLVLGQAGSRPVSQEELILMGQALAALMEEVETPRPPPMYQQYTPSSSAFSAPAGIRRLRDEPQARGYPGLPHDLVARRAARAEALLTLAAEPTSTLISDYFTKVAELGGGTTQVRQAQAATGFGGSGSVQGSSAHGSSRTDAGDGSEGGGSVAAVRRTPSAQSAGAPGPPAAKAGAAAPGVAYAPFSKPPKPQMPGTGRRDAGEASANSRPSAKAAGFGGDDEVSKFGRRTNSKGVFQRARRASTSSDEDESGRAWANTPMQAVARAKSWSRAATAAEPAQPAAPTAPYTAGSRAAASQATGGGAVAGVRRRALQEDDLASPRESMTPRARARSLLSPLDILRLIQQRSASGDRPAAEFWPPQARRIAKDGAAMTAIFGLPASETVRVVAKCSLVGCPEGRTGDVMLSDQHLAFTTLLEDGARAAKAAESTLSRLFWSTTASDAWPPDISVLLPLKDIERMDFTYHKAAEGIAVSMLTRATYVLHSFEAGCAPELMSQIRLHVMGWGIPLDRSLRGLDVTDGPLQLALPPGESILRSYACSKYGVVADSRGVLYLCTSMVVLDTSERRYTIPYSEISALRRDRDWRGAHWVQIAASVLPRPLWVGDGSEQLAIELLAGIARQGA